MNIVVTQNKESIGAYAAKVIADRVRQGPCVLGLATGDSPAETYKELIRMHNEDGLSFKDVTIFTLDEYVGLSSDHEQSYNQTIRTMFTNHVDVPEGNVHTPKGDSDNPFKEAAAYDERVRAAGVDIQLLGIGSNGHIAFNEPMSSFTSRTRVEALTDQTIADNARFFDNENEVPKRCITQGLDTILQAKHALLVSHGMSKADAIACAIEGPVATNCPGSLLQFHQKVTFVLEPESASKLSNSEYYAKKVQIEIERAEAMK